MIDQLTLDFTLPATPGTVEQRAAVFTALGGERPGELTYRVPLPDCEAEFIDALNHFAEAHGRMPDARVMLRTVTVGKWRAAC